MNVQTASIFLASVAASALFVVGCNSVLGLEEGTPGDPNAVTDSGVTIDSVVTDTHSDTNDSGKTDTAGDTNVPDTKPDAVTDTKPDTTPIVPEGGVAAAPIAGGVIAEDGTYKIIMQTTQGGANAPMTNSKYNLHGGTVTVTTK